MKDGLGESVFRKASAEGRAVSRAMQFALEASKNSRTRREWLVFRPGLERGTRARLT
jgi:hypothetical protein